MPSRTTRPRPISPTMRPAPSGVEGPAPSEIEGSPTRTRASVTRCTTARTLLPLLRIQPGLGFFDVHERADDHVLAVVGHEPRRHRLERAGKEQVQQQRLDEVVQMMTEGNLRRADLGGDSVEHPAPQARAER